MKAATAILTLAALAQSALATIYVTAPVATTTYQGGGTGVITWEDDGTAPSLSTIGTASVGIYAGNSQQQTLLQEIIGSVNVATTASIQFTIDPTIGPDGSDYFIRFQSLTYTDPTEPAYPYEQFSARFTLTDMTGTFNATVQAQINGATGAASVAGPAATTSAKAASNSAAAVPGASTAASHSTTGAAAGASTTAKSGAVAIAPAAVGKALTLAVAMCVAVLAL